MKTLIVIPARYGSTRFPGKPLALISGQSMLSRVAQVAQSAIEEVHADGIRCDMVVATEDESRKFTYHFKELFPTFNRVPL